MKLFCDEMLARLGRWLRAAGYDTLIVTPKMADSDILDEAIREDRILLTRDQHFISMPNASNRVIYLKGNTLQESVEELTPKLHIQWTYHPFSRCLICNTLLARALEPKLENIPPDILKLQTQVSYCKTCDKLFWLGSHTRRMLDQLSAWKKLEQ